MNFSTCCSFGGKLGSLPGLPFGFASVRPARVAVALAVAVALSWSLGGSARATNTVITLGTGKTDITTSASYGGTAPSSTTDILFSSANTYTSPLTDSIASMTTGTINDGSGTALTITDNSATTNAILNISGAAAANASSGTGGSLANVNDVIYVASGGSLTFAASGSSSKTLTLDFTTGGSIDDAGTLSIASAVNITNGKTLTFTGAGATTVSGALGATSGAITDNASGKLTLSGANLNTGGLTISQGTVVDANAAAGTLGSGVVSMANSTTLDLGDNSPTVTGLSTSGNGTGVSITNATGGTAASTLTIYNSSTTPGTYTFAGAISNGTDTGGLGLAVTGGIQVLSGTNTYSGGSSVSNGAILDFQNTNAQPASGTTSVAAGGTLGLGVGGTYGYTSANIDSLFANSLTNVSMSSTSLVGIDTTNASGGSFTYASNISGTEGLNKLGTNTLVLTGTNSYTGGTVVTGGILDYQVTSAQPSTGVTTVNANQTLALGVGPGGYTSANIDSLFAGTLANVTMNASAGVGIDTTGATFTYASNQTNNRALTVFGTGSLNLSGASTNNGQLTLTGGTLILSGTNSSAGVTKLGAVSGGTLELDNINNGGLASGGLQFNGGGSISALIPNITVSNIITNYTGMTVVGSNAITFSGVYTPSQNKGFFNNVAATGNTVIFSAPTFNIDNATSESSGNDTIIGGTGTGNTLISSVIQDSSFGIASTTKASLNIQNTAGEVILTGTNTYENGTVISGVGGTTLAENGSALGYNVSTSIVQLYKGAALDYIAPNGATPLTIGGTLALGYAGSGTTTIGGSIGTTATGDEIAVTGKGSGSGTILVNVYGINGVTPVSGTNTAYTLIAGATGGTLNGGSYSLGTVYNNTNFTVGSTITVSTQLVQVAVTSGTAGTTPITSAYWVGGLSGAANVWAASNGSTASNWATSSGGSVQALIPGSTASVVVSSSAISTAPTSTILGSNMTINNLTISDTTNGLGLNADGNTLTIAPTSSSTGITVNASVPASSIAANVALGANQTWTNNSANALTVSGAVSGSSTLTTAGTGTTVLAGGNTYSGGTTVSSGNLQLTTAAVGSTISATGTGAVAVSGGSGAAISGTGQAAGLVTVSNGSVIAPGVNTSGTNNNFGSVGTLGLGTTSGLTLSGNATLAFDLGTTNTVGLSDVVTTTTFTLTGATPTFDFSGTTVATGVAYDLINDTSVTGFNSSAISTVFVGPLAGNYTATYSLGGGSNNSDLDVTFSAAPEPGTLALMLGGLGLLVVIQRHRRPASGSLNG